MVALGRPASEAASADSSRSLRDLVRLARAARGAELDAFLFPSMLTYFPVPGVPTVVGLHDTIAEDLPDLTFPSRRSRIALGAQAARRDANGRPLFTVSAASREALARQSRRRSRAAHDRAGGSRPRLLPSLETECGRVLSGSGSTGSVASSSTPAASARTRTSRRCSTLTPGSGAARCRAAARARRRPRARDVRLRSCEHPAADRRARIGSTRPAARVRLRRHAWRASTRPRPRWPCRRSRKASGCPRSRLPPAALRSFSATCPRTASRSARRRSLLRATGPAALAAALDAAHGRRRRASRTRRTRTSSSRRAHVGRGGRTASRPPARGGARGERAAALVLHGHDVLPAAPLRGRRDLRLPPEQRARAARSSGDRRLQPRRVSRARRDGGCRARRCTRTCRSARSRRPTVLGAARHLPERAARAASTLAPASSSRESASTSIHFHNVSLVGGPGVLAYGDGIKLYTTHEHWLVCPMHTLWRLDRETCERPTCLRCTLAYRRPPQLWRYGSLLERSAREVDLFLSPEPVHDRDASAARLRPADAAPAVLHPGSTPRRRLPLRRGTTAAGRPYFLVVARLEKLKGVQTLIELFAGYDAAELARRRRRHVR